MRRLNKLLMAHPWLMAGIGASIMFVAFLGEWPLPAAAAVATAAFLLFGWAWTKGPASQAFEEERRAGAAGEKRAQLSPSTLLWYGVIAVPFGIFMLVWGVTGGIGALVLVGTLVVAAGIGSLMYRRRKMPSAT